ncbi:MAG: hypothetical protein INQ03_25240 [Candidatus Heimdallarchaeota archaeon]|nr:hypothetical protein [Candidatus Heimdallarchaeota archaeon]
MIEIDLGIILISILAGIFGAFINFFQKSLKAEMTGRVKNIKLIVEEVRENRPMLRDIRLRSKEERTRQFKGFIRKQIREFMKKHNLTLALSLFFGIVASLLFLLISDVSFSIELNKKLLNFIIGSISAGYAGESFVDKLMGDNDPFADLTVDEIKNAILVETS